MPTPASGLRERKKERTRRQIKLAAFALIVERGWAATTIEAIAEAAEVAPRTVSIYFPSKLDIVFGDPPETAVRLREILADPEVAIVDGMTRWMALEAEWADVELSRLRLRAIRADSELRARDHASMAEYERVVAEAVSRRTGEPADEIGPRLVGACAGELCFALRDYLQRTSPPVEVTRERGFELLGRMCAAVGTA